MEKVETATASPIDCESLVTDIRTAFASHVDLPVSEIFDGDLALAEIIARSETLHNSIDLMEAFAKTANRLKKQYGIQVRLPALSLDTSISTVLDIFLAEVEKYLRKT